MKAQLIDAILVMLRDAMFSSLGGSLASRIGG
jgi:hypothetical protein